MAPFAVTTSGPVPATDAAEQANLADQLARTLRDDFLGYDEEFRNVTRRARTRFEQRDWKGAQRDAAERIGLYDVHVEASVRRLRSLLAERAAERALWRRAKASFAALVDRHADLEFTKTWFSSVARRLCGIQGVDPDLEFVGQETIPLRNIHGPLIGRSYVSDGSLQAMFRRLLDDFRWSVPYADMDRCAAFLAAEVTEHYRRHHAGDTVVCVDVMTPVFYRGTHAYLIGKATGWTHGSPLIIALRNVRSGIEVEAVILSEDRAHALFGFARSYFHVDLDPVGAAIVFLRRVVPRETVHELFATVGRAKQAKTERYRGLSRHLQFSRDRFRVAPGVRGMVMAVFTLPSYDVVFKVIRDRFAPPKDTTREEVRRRYDLVARHDKAGRLVDTQEFRQLRFPRERFDPALLDELLGECAETVRVEAESVVLGHCYLERRLRPLDLFLREVRREDAIAAVLDYGQALRDLAATNIFPGDLLLKNFGVSRTGRVIFYDYDEICLLTDCEFRAIPRARTWEDELRAEPWFPVGPHDVFPEEFAPFLGLDDELLRAFRQFHGELLTKDFWRDMQERLRQGEVIDVLPV